jgi:ankyrin repeat protein
METVRSDSAEAVQILLESGADVKATNDRGETALMLAARADIRSDVSIRMRLLKFLLDRGADVLAKDKSGQTALHFAVEQVMSEAGGFQARAEIVRLLLESGADVNGQDNRGKTALMNFVPALTAPVDIGELLIDKGADVNLQNEQAKRRHARCGQGLVALVRHSSKRNTVDATDKLGRTAVFMAPSWEPGRKNPGE